MKCILLLMVCAVAASAADRGANNSSNQVASKSSIKKVGKRPSSDDWNGQLDHPRRPSVPIVPPIVSMPATPVPIAPAPVVAPVINNPALVTLVVNNIKVTAPPLSHRGGGEDPSSRHMCCDGEGFHAHIADPGPRDVNWNRDCNGNIVEFLSGGRYESRELPEQQLKRLKKELAELKETPEQELARLKAELKALKALQRK